MLAILGGLGAAVAWCVSTLCSSRSSRMIDPSSVVAWVALVGLLMIGPVAAFEGVPGSLDAGSGGWLLLAGAGNVGGLLVAYAAYRAGDVALIAPIIATEGAIAAVIAFAFGEHVQAASALVLGVIALGVSLAAMPARQPDGARGHVSRVVVLAGLASLCFGASLYATGRVSSVLPLAWVVLSARLLGTIAVAVPLVLAGRLQLTARAAPLLLLAGVCEVLGVASFTLGARHDVAIAAVLSSQFAAMSVVAAYVLFGERLGRVQLRGVVLVLVGVSVLSVLNG
jgi:drug/metabolite transporter (DMT)-like permease